METYKIVGGLLPWDVKVIDPDGKEVKGITEININPITPTDPVKATITLEVKLDLQLEGDAVDISKTILYGGYELQIIDHEWPFGTLMQAEPREPGWYLLEKISNRVFGPYQSPALAEAAVIFVATQLKAEDG